MHQVPNQIYHISVTLHKWASLGNTNIEKQNISKQRREKYAHNRIKDKLSALLKIFFTNFHFLFSFHFAEVTASTVDKDIFGIR